MVETAEEKINNEALKLENQHLEEEIGKLENKIRDGGERYNMLAMENQEMRNKLKETMEEPEDIRQNMSLNRSRLGQNEDTVQSLHAQTTKPINSTIKGVVGLI